ncbi:hypothetical protein IVA88_26840 [Bradyrhizobium sp. 149]|uniref:hypothetical protein n=1 Tax=Bradyrhizobium sp. 149 TaxID=2782624 RepID=UPI001FF8BB7E|nr:hypothetical protein [Bradyrhizobium sp. 149]MCK1655037.1 hypothetical protein [Bradyrhizobium sp. 149]
MRAIANIWKKARCSVRGFVADRRAGHLDDSVSALDPKTYLIFSQASYLYTPSVKFVLKSSITLSDVSSDSIRTDNALE